MDDNFFAFPFAVTSHICRPLLDFADLELRFGKVYGLRGANIQQLKAEPFHLDRYVGCLGATDQTFKIGFTGAMTCFSQQSFTILRRDLDDKRSTIAATESQSNKPTLAVWKASLCRTNLKIVSSKTPPQ